jgi:NADPH:quinone reductase-like Zn-dependent oxidoreductase
MEAAMRKVIAERAGGPEVLTVVEVPAPVPGPGEVAVRAEAIGVNFADVWARLGVAGEPPFAPGIEVAGTVVAVGEGVSWPAAGDRVAATPFERAGAYAEVVVSPARYAFPVPDGMAAPTAAALVVNYLTAYAAIEVAARPAAGERVLVHAAAGGVGLAAVQLARRRGARLLATASAAKHQVLAEEGAELAVDYRTEDWVAAVLRHTGDGVDVVVDGVGEDAFRRSLSVTRFGGRVVAYGYTAGVTGPDQPPADLAAALGVGPSPLELMSDARALMGVHMAAPPATMRRWWDDLLVWHAAGEVSPRIDRVLPLADAAKAHHRLHARQNVGKLVLVP